ncbi:MAG TPA: C2 family cysteine protease [Planctomycetaceae bacterium]
MTSCVRHSQFVTMALVLAAWAGWPHAAQADRPAVSFQKVVEDRFRYWDRDHDGVLTALEVDRLVQDREIQGNEAAAIAAIHVGFRAAEAPSRLSPADLLRASDKQSERRDKDDHHFHFAADYATFDRHVHELPRQIFTVANAPSLEGIAQGKLGDCYLVAVVGAAVHRDPRTVRNMFRIHIDGSNEIAFPNGQMLKVPPLTDAEIMLGSSAANQGLWLNVLEKAYGQLKLQIPQSARSLADLDLDVIARGGDALQTLSLLTGHKADWNPFHPGKTNDNSQPTPAQIVAARDQLHARLAEAAAHRRLVCISSPKTKLPPGVISGHDYAMLGYDSKLKTVHVWNPWGRTYNFTPKGERHGLEHGYVVQKGHFDIPLDDFAHVFNGVWFETQEPLLVKHK